METTVLNQKTTHPEFLSGGGEMGKLIRSFDWSKTPLGLPDTWPQSLRTTVSLCMASNFPIAIAWGPHRVQMYNDGYQPITGDMHPGSMGQDFKECWKSAWPVIGPAFEDASLGQTRFLENQRIFLDRYGYKEETFFTFSFSPILDESGGVGGLFHPVIELTQQTLAERRLNVLRAVADSTVNARTVGEASSLILECLKDFKLDIPFVLLYSIATDGKEANLQGSVGVETNSPLVPVRLNLQEQQSNSWPFAEVIQNGKAVQVEELEKIFGTFNCGPYAEPPEQALVFPVTLHGTAHTNYFLVTGVSSRRSLDEKYRLFYELLTASVTNSLTKARAYEDERKKAEALAEIDKAKTVFFNNISHEFRTPLTLMLGSLEELLTKRNDEIAAIDKQAIETSHRNAMRLLRLVNNLLDFSRIEAGKVKAQYRLTDIAKYTTDLASNFRSVIEIAGLLFTIKTDTVTHPVYLDKEMWEKIVLNLLSNAFKYTLKGSITISLDMAPLSKTDFNVQFPSSSGEGVRHMQTDENAEGSGVRLQVADTGVGIPEAELPKMFQRFHRVQNAVGRTYEGTGIGLSLVSELVKLHGGEIRVQSKEGEGSVFTVFIPAGKAHLPIQQVVEKELDSTAFISDAFIEEATTLIDHSFISGNGADYLEVNADAATVLVVDDNADMRAYITKLLQKQYNVITANNGMDALHQVKKHSPQLIVSDVMMPVMDGIQLVKAVKEARQTSNIPVILLSARAGEDEKIEGYDIGADDYLVKPFSAKELLARVASNIKTAKSRLATEQNLRNVIAQAPVAMCLYKGPGYKVEIVNKKMLEIWGKPLEAVINKPVFEGIPEAKGQGFEELLYKVYSTGESFSANEIGVTLLRNNKIERLYVNLLYEPYREADGTISGIVEVANDISAQIEARKKVEESEKKFQAAIAAVEGIIWTNNATGEMQGDQPGWANLTGQSFEEYQGYGWSKAIHPDDAQPTIDAWNIAVADNRTFEFEHRVKTKQDGWKLFSVKAVPVFDEDGAIQQWVGVHTDITEQREAAQRIKESESYFRTLTDTVPAIIWITEPDGSCSYLNKLWYNYTGQTKDEAKGFGWLEATHPDDKEQAAEIFIQANSAQKPFSLPYRLRNAKGEYRWAVDSGSPKFDADGVFEGMIGTVVDVHEEKLAEEKLAYRTALLEAHNQASLDGILLVDAKGKIISYNQRFIEIWNMPQHIVAAKDDEAALSFAMTQLVHPQQFIDKVKYLYDNPTETSLDELEYIDGKVVERNGYAVIGEDGSYYAWSWTFKDITQRKKIEQDLKNTKEQLELTFKNIPAGVYLINQKGEVVYVNDKGAAVYGDFTPEDLLAGKNITALLKTADELFERYDENGNHFGPQKSPAYISLTTGRPSQAVLLQINRITKEQRWHYVQGAPLFDEERNVSMVLVTSTDITLQKNAEHSIRQSEENFRSFSNSIYNLAWMADADGYIYWYNQRWYDYTGTTLDDMKGWGWSKVHHPGHLERVVNFVTEAWKKPEPFELTFPLRSKEEEYRWFLTRVVPILDEDGNIQRWIGTNTDINNQKLAEDRFRTLSETLPQLVWMTDKNGKYEYASNQWMEYSGLDPHDESTWPLLVYGDDMEPMMKAWTWSLSTGESYHAEARLKSKEGEYRWHFVQGEPVRDEEGKILKWIGAFTDIHVQKTIEEKLEKLVAERTKELERSNEDLQQFAHVASHDLKEPVRKVRTFGSRMEEEFGNQLPEKAKLYLDKMQAAADRMFGLIDGVLNYSTINSLESSTEIVDLTAVIQNIQADLEVVIQQKGAQMDMEHLPIVKGSSVLLNQLFYNLINNSLKFSKPGVPPVVAIRFKTLKGEEVRHISVMEAKNEFVQIRICDNGIGFSQEYAEKIFKTFTRLNSRDQYEGTGLGLALCKKIVERHNGYIYATATTGEGACFYVLLPV